MGTLSSFYVKETLKDAKKINIQPEMLEVRIYILTDTFLSNIYEKKKKKYMF